MKSFCKRIIACFSVLAMFVATLGTAGAIAAQEVPVPTVSSWIENGTGYPCTAEMSISYNNGSAYNGKYSLTALYNRNNTLVGIGCGLLDANGASKYTVQINSEDAATVKCFIWDDLSTVKQSVPVYVTTYENFINNIEFYVPAGAFGIRNSFESGLFRIFQDQNTCDLEIVEDSSAAHTGTKYVEVSNRTEEKGTLRLKVTDDEIGANKKVKVSVYVKKPETVTDAEFYVRTTVLKASADGKDNVVLYSDPVAVTDNNWHKVTGEIDLSAADVPKHIGDCVIEIGARTGSADSYTYIDYFADDFVVTCPDAAIPFIFDDKKADNLQWTFEDGTVDELTTGNRFLNQIKDINKWTIVLKNQPMAIENIGSDANAPTGSTKALSVQTTGDKTNAHITSRIKISKLDFVPGNTYEISFWARGNKQNRALYIGLVKQNDSAENSTWFNGGNTSLAGGIIDYNNSDNYTKNRAGIMSTSWQKYTYTIKPSAENFNEDGYANLCFVMTGYDPATGKPDDGKNMLAEEKLYLDEIEVTKGAAVPSTDVPEFVVPTGAIGLRNSFESGLFQIFQNRPTAAPYDAEIVEDSNAAHTGTKYAKVTNRNNKERATLRVKMPNAETSLTTTIDVKAYMKKPETVTENAELYVTIVVPSSSGPQYKTGGIVSVSDNEWHEVSYSLDISTVTGANGDCVVELGARTGSADNYKYVDYCVDDFTVICPKAKQAYVFDDTKTDKLKWTFEGKNTNDAVTTNRNLNRLYDTNKWTNVLKDQPVAVEDTSAEKNAPTGSTQMLTVQPSGANTNAHVTARMKLSKLDIKPNKKYKISFWARGNYADRALYIGLLDHEDNAPANNFIANNKTLNYLASGIIDYSNSANYAINRAALMTTSWTKYTYTISTKDTSFNDDGFADLYFVMVAYNPDTKQPINTKTMLADDKLYLDEIEITEVENEGVAAIVNDGMYTKRAAFESDNMDMFSPDTRSSVVLTTATANTGSYSAEFSDRRDNWTSLATSLKGADSNSTITVSGYLKKNQLRV